MSYEISYRGDNTGRRALNDLIGYIGLSRSKIIFRAMRSATTFADLDAATIMASFCGVSGEPVRRLIARCHGESVLAAWSNAPQGDPTQLASVQ